ncbi:cytochrome c3 family protein [Desulfovibrio oxyclinae]|uniref:cytochrome c3 family protein n=1 Tax=Desulfovibrio oxyclinae TaxID=63560 RepID=UPI000377FAD0|nr:cytochrome c3 family protein [Desulfovibrio oxyclinae]
MRKRYIPITVIALILLAVSVVGYVTPAETESPPVKILLETKGGNVLFAHQKHLDDYDIACGDCHHTSGSDPNPPRCTDCHPSKFSPEYLEQHSEMQMPRRQCASCHHARADISPFDHQGHIDDYAYDCTDCHHGPEIEDEPQRCANCHGPEGSEKPSLMNAAHERCAQCHEDKLRNGYRKCGYCHTRKVVSPEMITFTPCSDCHRDPVSNSIPARVAAFHERCMGCHERFGAGPYGEDACYQCHINQ